MGATDGLREEIVTLIQKQSNQQIPYQQFMELALYHPKWGYYSQNRVKLGRKGDFYTNAHVGKIYGHILTRAFMNAVQKWTRNTDLNGSAWQLIEIGAGDGSLMEQVIQTLIEFEVAPDEVQIGIVETSEHHQQVQQERLQPLSPYTIQWAKQLEEMTPSEYTILYSNELIDAFSVHLLEWTGQEWLEIYVKEADGRWIERLDTCSSSELSEALQQLPVPSREGQRVEMNLQARRWLISLSNWMKAGTIFTIDYGGSTDELYTEFRHEGTIRGFHQHQLVSYLAERVGETDITAHVNFDLLKQWGTECGLKMISYQSQAEFLLENGILEQMPAPGRDPFSKSEKARRSIQQLIHPQWMGEVFRVLVQQKETSSDHDIF